jgi:DNA-binding HxlR family transcriptional regulator
MKKGYGQYCPMAKAVEIVGERWTPLVLRELLDGGRRFSEIRRGVPLMSPALLTKRLKDLESRGVIHRSVIPGTKTQLYCLSPAGEELRPILVGLAMWGQKWVEDRLGTDDLDAGVLMWEMHGRLNVSALPSTNRTVICFEYDDAPAAAKRWWMVIEDGDVDLCQSDPGHDVDLYISSSLLTMTEVWIGRASFSKALREDDIEVIGDRTLEKSIRNWLRLSKLAEITGTV